MTETELLQVLACGEGSRHQFKRDQTDAASQHVRPAMQQALNTQHDAP
jgi:hypothetical protein